jgi:hypothetical protein
MSCMNRIELTVTINGTGTNPWHRFGLRQNPFPQTGKAEYAAGERKLASLDGDPVRTADDIRERLAGFDPAFVEGVIQLWQPGRRVRFKIAFQGGHNTAEPSGESSAGDVPLAVGRSPGCEPVTRLLTEVRTREHGTRPLPEPGEPGDPSPACPGKEPGQAMSVFESPRYQETRDRMKSKPAVRLMAAGIASVPLAEISGEDGTPRSWFISQASRAFADAEARNASNPACEPYPAGGPRHIGLVAEAVLACRAEIRAAVARLIAPPGTSPESAEVTRVIIWMRTETLTAIADSPQILRLCDGCYQAATGLIAECEDGCPQESGHTGLCLRDGPDDCPWCGNQDRLRDVPRPGIVHLLPTAGQGTEGQWWLHFTDGAQGPYPSQRAAWDDWQASARPGEGGTRP